MAPMMAQAGVDINEQTEITEFSWQGPIPPPAVFRAIEDIIPGGANRLLLAFEGETAHRHRIESRQQLLPFVDNLIGRVFALLFAAACLGVVVYAISVGAQWTASIMSGAMILGGINAFMRIRNATPPSKKSKSSRPSSARAA
jgi:uncharacterized membrane protein